MDREYEPIQRLLAAVRARYRALAMFSAIVRAALAASAAVGGALIAASLVAAIPSAPWVFAAVGGVALLATLAAVAWGLSPLREVISDRRIARFIEERVPALDDRLATAVDVAGSDRGQTGVRPGSDRGQTPTILTALLVADVARRAAAVDLNEIVPGKQLRRSGVRAGAAALMLLVFAIVAREPARQSVDAASLVLFPAKLRLDVRPGHARVKPGTVLSIEARIAGNRAPASARVEVSDGDKWRGSEMSAGSGRFQASLAPAIADFKYRVTVGGLVSPTYDIKVVRAPRISRIDVDYTYPPATGLRPRTEMDGGDLYAPEGTVVRLHVFADQPAATGQLSLSNGASINLASASPTEMTADTRVTQDGSYRITLRDSDGMADESQTEYFIRVLDDRPPEVHVVKPASDRSVTPLEEVEIEAQADDDYGLERVELVYAIRGQTERAVRLDVPTRATSATVRHMLYLEELGVRPGDFVSYYVRARDITRGTRPSEGRSDIFFLEVRPYEQEFALQQSQSMAGAGYSGSIDDLVNAQKQIVVATWKLDRRAASAGAKAARSPQDVRAIGRSEAELKMRAEETASSLRESTMRDPRRRLPGRGSDPSDGPRIGQTMPEEDAMTKAVEAMGRAVTALDAVDTGAALPPEMQALNGFLEAQALVKKRQIARQQSAQAGAGSSNRNYDISTLFDKELQRLQQTNYETRQSSEQKRAPDDLAEKIRSLARRQDELLRQQEELARRQLSEDERKRQLEKLTREQAELRQQTEELARQMSTLQGDQSRRLQEAADDMRSATSDLRRRDSASGRARGNEALEKLKNLERRAGGAAQERPNSGKEAGGNEKGRDPAQLSNALARARELRQKLDALTRDLQKSGSSRQQSELRDQAARELQRTRELIDDLTRQDPSLRSGGPGLTFEGQGMTFSSPGTEGFKQDFARWQALRDQATTALARIESALSKQLQDRQATDRLAAGIDDKAPASYRSRVDDYFKAIAAKKTP